MTPLLLTVVLAAALLHASWNAMVKSGGDRLLVLAAVNAVSGLAGGVMVLLNPPPAVESWPWLALSVVLHWGYYFFLLQAFTTPIYVGKFVYL